MDPCKYFSAYNLKEAGRKQKFEYVKKCQFERKIFTLSPTAYIKINIKKLVSDLFHAGSALAESESTKRKSRLSE